MIRDVAHVLGHVAASLHLVRGVLLALLLILVPCTVVLGVGEGLPLGEALYLVAITALTVGYGDISPTTGLGRVVAVVIGLIGVVLVGIVVAVVNIALSRVAEDKRRHARNPPAETPDR